MKKINIFILAIALTLSNFLNAQFNKGLLLDGCSNYLEVESSSNLLMGGSGITIEAWIMPNCDDGNRMIVSKQWCNNQYGYYLSVFDGKLFWSISPNGFCTSNSNFETSSVQISSGVFTHIAIVHDATSIKLFVNGNLVPGQFSGGSFIPIYPSFENIRIGAYKNVGGSFGNFFSGIIDELRFYDAPLTDQQISQNYNLPLAGNESNLVLYYDMEDFTGSGVNLRIDNKCSAFSQHHAEAKGFMGNRPIIVLNDEYLNEELELDDEIEICGSNYFVHLDLDSYKEILWSTGETSEAINVVNEGLYSVTVETELCRFLFDEIEVVKNVVEVTEMQNICPNDSIYFNNQWIFTSGIYQDSLISQNDCDTIISLVLDFYDENISFVNYQLCQGDSILINDKWIKLPGSYIVNDSGINGCDSTTSITIDFIPLQIVNDTFNLCLGDSVLINNKWYKEEQTVSYVVLDSDCPTQFYSYVKANFTWQILNEINLCSNDSIFFNNQWIHNSGLYQQVLTSQDGCDSTITLDVIFQDTVRTISQIDLCQGDSLLINGQWIYEGGDFNEYSTSANGCDSLATIIVDLIPQVGIFDTINLCQGDSVLINNKWYFDGQDVTYFDLNSFCPVIVTSTIESRLTYNYLDTVKICANDSVLFNNSWIKIPGQYQELLTSTFGCDSLISLNLLYFDTIRTSIEVEICQGDSILIGANWVSQSGTYQILEINDQGCDSLVVISLNLVEQTNIYDTINVCAGDSVYINNNWISDEQIISYFDLSSNCPKQIFASVLIKPLFNQFYEVKTCSNDSIFFNNQWIYNAGLYQQVLTSQDGCDSTITLDVIFIDTIKTVSQIQLCQGDSLLINGQWIYEGGDFNEYSTSANGCDSLATIIVDLIPQVGIFDTINVCQGDSVLINNSWYFDAQDVTYFDLNSFCPISVTSTIESLPSYSFIDNISICPNDSIFYKGSWISSEGSFSFNYKTNLGCDSVFILNTVQIPLPDEPISLVDCDSGIYELTVDTETNWSFTWSNGSLSNPTIFSDDTTASIFYTHNDIGCLVDYNIDLPSIPFDGEVPFFGDTIVYPGKPLKYMVDLDGKFWSLDWYRDGNLNCEGCFEHMIQTQSPSNIDLVFTHISGCAYYRNFSIDIDATQDLYIPNIFAPESTTGNDKWRIYIPECFTIQMVNIYDRWGNLVYITENPSVIEWDGTYRGKYLEQGVYAYLITYTDPAFVQKMKSGDVTLIR